MNTAGAQRASRALLTALALALAAAATAEPVSLAEREVAVYSALIRHGLADAVPLVVVGAQTTGDPAALAGHDDAPALVAELGAPPEAFANWQQRNAGAFAIDHPLDLPVSYLLLDDTTRARLFANVEPAAGWQRFFERYAGAPGLLRLSRAGFDDRLEHALVYVEHHCGADCGSGRLAHLVHDADGGWQVRGAALVWMAE